jgi:Cu(I)/Ag(I) efflux system membrane fusion protein
MNRNNILIGSLVVASVLAAVGYGAYRLGLQQGMTGATGPVVAHSTAEAPDTAHTADPSAWTIAQGQEATERHLQDGIKAGDIDPATGRKVLYYHDPMTPGKKFDAPGKSPFMDMLLVPQYAGALTDSESGDSSQITVSPRIQQNIGLRTAPVISGHLTPQVSAVGAIAWNERDQAVVQARATGFVEKLHVRATFDRIEQGQPLVDLYIPDWVAAQEEFLSIKRMQGSDLAALVEAARVRMRQAGMPEALIKQVERKGRAQAHTTIVAPIGGVLAELMVREGMTVTTGMALARINGLSTVWAEAQVPESLAALLHPGMRVTATSPAAPGERFEGQMQALLPEVNPETRTLKARMELANPTERLVPGMFVEMSFIEAQAAAVLLVPTEAVIQTGKRAVVMLAGDGGTFRLAEVETGTESGGQTEIRRGLREGQQVVLSGQFLIDSEASLKGLEARLNDATESPVEGDQP